MLKEQANLLVMPDLDAANIAFNLVKQLAGAARSVHILTPSVTARGILNMSAVAAVGSQHRTASTPRKF